MLGLTRGRMSTKRPTLDRLVYRDQDGDQMLVDEQVAKN